jgi:carbon monoxide dehydrogenase subunit G
MSQTVVRSIVVRCPHDEVARFVTDPHQVLEAIPGFARFSFVGPGDAAGEEEWDVFLEVATLHVGGRVVVTRPSPSRLRWVGERGTRHSFSLTVEPVGEYSLVTMHLEYSFAGLLMARVSELLGRAIAARHLEAGLEQVRHRLEYGDVVGGP